jgi:hypothetical protein
MQQIVAEPQVEREPERQRRHHDVVQKGEECAAVVR